MAVLRDPSVLPSQEWGTIPELESMERIEELQDELQADASVFNVSHWDSSPFFRSSLRKHLRLPLQPSPEPYIYSYWLQKGTLLRRLRFEPERKGCLVTPSGSISTLCAMNWLRLRQVKSLHIVCPAYFAAFHVASALSLPVNRSYMVRSGKGFKLSLPELNSGDALWISDPVYSTGVALNKAVLAQLARIAEKGTPIVLDLCLKASFQYSKSLKENPHVVVITSPHKAVCLNGIKFSAVIFDKSHTQSFEHWADALTGGLGFSSQMALEHYQSSGFVKYGVEFQKLIRRSRSFVAGQLKRNKTCRTDICEDGYFQAIYFPRVSALLEHDVSFLRKVFEECGACFIPGNRNYFPPDWGFGFRINHARDCPQFRGAVSRLISYLGRF